MEEKKYLKLNDVEAYRIAFHLSNQVWPLILGWENFARDTIGKQMVRAIDSISANVAEGFGRYGKKDKVKFYRYAYGSTIEALDWNEKAKSRRLITHEQYDHIFTSLQKLPKLLNILIKYTQTTLNT